MTRFRGIGIGQRLTYFDGASVKALGSPWDVDNNVGWTSLSGDEDKTDEAILFSSVPWLYRAVRDRSNCVGHMPFKIELNGEEVEDDAVPFLDEPTVLFSKLETSLCLTGRAYAKMEVNSGGYIQALRYLVPTTITEHYNDLGECDYYERIIKGKKYQIPVEQVMAIYDPDWTTENGPGKSSAARAALTSAGVLYHTDLFITRYFQRGAIKATVLTTLGFSEVEAKRLQHWWDTVVAGVKNAWAAVVLKGEGVKPVVIGEGLESLQNETLTSERRQNIATALGIPESRMWSAAANYATAEQDTKNYYLSTIIPECELIAEALNAQVFTAAHNLEGYELEFQSETLDIFQAEAADQAGALQALVNAGFPLLMAADLVGIDLTDAQRAELEAMEADAQPGPIPAQLAPFAGQDNQPALPAPVEAGPVDNSIIEAMTADQVKDLDNWRQIALRKFRKREQLPFDFVCKALDYDRAEEIKIKLIHATSEDDIIKAFVVQAQPEPVTDQLKRALDWLEAHEDITTGG